MSRPTQQDAIEALLKPSHRIILLHSMRKPDPALAPLPPGYSSSRTSHYNVEIHSENTDLRVVLDSQIDVLCDAKTKIASLGEIALPELIFFDFETSFQTVLRSKTPQQSPTELLDTILAYISSALGPRMVT